MSYILIDKKTNKPYDFLSYEKEKLESVENELTILNKKRIEKKMEILEQIKIGLDVLLSSRESILKNERDLDIKSLNKLLSDIEITISLNNDNIIIHNNISNKDISINKLGENCYRNIFELYQKNLKLLMNWKFCDYFIWKKITNPYKKYN